MKVLLANVIYYQEHKPFDLNFIIDVSKLADVTVLTPKEWYLEMKENIKIEERMVYKKKFSKFEFYRMAISNVNILCNYAEKNDFDIVFLLEYEVLLLPMIVKKINKICRIVIIQHNNIDIILNNKMKLFFFNICKNDVNHFILEPFILEALKDYLHVKEQNIFCYPHPLPPKLSMTENRISLVGLSQSNDEEIIKNIITREEREKFLKENNLCVVLKSKEYSYDDGYLKVIKGWINKTEYDYLIGNAECIFVPFPENFRFRVSATIMEAIVNKKSIIATSIPLTEYYFSRYPLIGKTFNIDTLEKDLIELKKNSRCNNEDMERFKYDHCNDSRIKALTNYFNYISINNNSFDSSNKLCKK